jgi:hypothetical protein
MPPKLFWVLAGVGVAGGVMIWFFGKRPAYVLAGDPTLSFNSENSDSTATDAAPTENNNGQQ